jgi:hypothetical protein
LTGLGEAAAATATIPFRNPIPRFSNNKEKLMLCEVRDDTLFHLFAFGIPLQA